MKIDGRWRVVSASPPTPAGAVLADVVAAPRLAPPPPTCKHLGAETGELITCPSCRGNVQLKTFACARYGKCTVRKWVSGVACCAGGPGPDGKFAPCPGFEPEDSAPTPSPTTVAPVPTNGAAKPHILAMIEKRLKQRAAFPEVPLLPPASVVENAAPVVETVLAPIPAAPLPPPPPAKKLKWSCGLTCVPERRDALLPRTLASLAAAGWSAADVRLFVDGERGLPKWLTDLESAGHQITCRWPRLRTHGNWFLALHELFVREPNADRYAVFQDDFVTYRNLRAYLDAATYPEKGYLNLYTFPQNQRLAPAVGLTGRQRVGFFPSNQLGKGAVATVFSRAAALTLLSHPHMIERPMDAMRGHEAVDGGIVWSLVRKADFQEFCHNPSLVQHTGEVSSMRHKAYPAAPSFRGEHFDALELIAEVARDA